MKKMICIYHSRDLDGWMSAAIVKLRYPDVELIGWDYGQPIPDIPKGGQIIMVDISFPLTEMDLIASNVDLIQRDFIWIDHHISAIKECSYEVNGEYISGYGGVRDPKFAACELTWNFFFPDQKMPELVRLLGRYDCFGHKGTAEEQKVLEFQYGARQYISNPKEALTFLKIVLESEFKNYSTVDSIHHAGKTIYQYLCTEAKQIYARRFTGKLMDHVFACVNQERFNPINFGIDYHKDGYEGFMCFWYQNGKWTFSLYNDDGNLDCSEIAKFMGGGGHKGAAGFTLTNEQFSDMINISFK